MKRKLRLFLWTWPKQKQLINRHVIDITDTIEILDQIKEAAANYSNKLVEADQKN